MTGDSQVRTQTPERLRTEQPNRFVQQLEAALIRLSRAHRFQLALTLAGFVLLVVGSKWRTLNTWGSDVPFWDEWGVIGTNLLARWHAGTLDWGSVFFAPHNEHWIAWTQLWTLMLTALNGQWDPLFIATVNAVFHAAVGAFLLSRLWPVLRGSARWLAPGALALLLASPLTWENTLYAFQVQFYFLLATALVHIALVGVTPALSWRWWIGVGAGLAGLATMASSFLAPLAVIVVRVARARHAKQWKLGDIATVAVCGLLAVAGYALINPVRAHAPLHAQGLLDFVHAAARILAFPFVDVPVVCVVMQAPLACWLALRLRALHREWTNGEWFFLGFNVWLLFQAAGLAYARANFGDAIASRYFDLTGLLLVTNAAALGMLWSDTRTGLSHSRSLPLAVWAAIAVFGFLRQAQYQQQAHFAPMPGLWAARAARVQDFVINGNEDVLRKAPALELPYPSANELIDHLRDESLRALLPASLRAPVAFEPTTDHGFAPGPPPSFTQPPIAGTFRHSTGADAHIWRSTPVATERLLPVLRITFAGASGLHGRALRLVADDGREAPLEITGFVGTGWQSAHLFIARGARSVQLVAEAGPDGRWLTFAAPVELGLGSWIAHSARKYNGVLTAIGATLFAAGLFVSFRRFED